MDKLTATFRIQADDGTIFVVHEYTAQIDASTKGNPGVTMDGIKRLRTANAGRVPLRVEKLVVASEAA